MRRPYAVIPSAGKSEEERQKTQNIAQTSSKKRKLMKSYRRVSVTPALLRLLDAWRDRRSREILDPNQEHWQVGYSAGISFL